MRSIFPALIIALSFISNVRADDEITKIEKANLVCSKSGGAVFLNSTAKRLWQADSASETEGLELKVISFSQARCPNCFTVEGRLAGMPENMKMRYGFSGKMGSFKKATVVVTAVEKDEETGTETETHVRKMNCKVVPTDSADETDTAQTWGGKHIELTVTGQSARLAFDCGAGTVKSGWKKNTRGIIKASGTTVSFSGGPRRPEEPAPVPVATDFVAKIKGNKMTLTLRAGTGESTFKLVKGAPAELFRCM